MRSFSQFLLVGALVLLPAGASGQSITEKVRALLVATVRLDISGGRVVTVQVDSVAAGSDGAALVNGHRRIYQYLVQHQVAPDRLFGTVTADDAPHAAFLRVVLADRRATATLASYLESMELRDARGDRRVTGEASVLAIASRFFHPVVVQGKSVGFYQCAGINGIEGLGAARDPAVEAFAFWALSAVLFDADSASPVAKELNADFSTAKAVFAAAAKRAGYASPAILRAQNALYVTMSRSPALDMILRNAYRRAAPQLPFRVAAWN